MNAYFRSVPSMERVPNAETGITVLADTALRAQYGIAVMFTERTGGVSSPPYESLNLAGHVGDDPAHVDENRRRLLSSAGLGQTRGALVTAEQVHGDRVTRVTAGEAGRGAYATPGHTAPLASTDGLVTTQEGIPLMMLYADCVPVVFAAPGPTPGVAVAHAGWRGTLSGIAAATAAALLDATGANACDLNVYVGPSVKQCCYEVAPDLISRFANAFDTIPAVGRALDLAAAVVEDLGRVGIPQERIFMVESCTADDTDRFFSYRASHVTGRHAAVACIVKGD